MPRTESPSQYTIDSSIKLNIFDKLLRLTTLGLKAMSTTFKVGIYNSPAIFTSS